MSYRFPFLCTGPTLIYYLKPLIHRMPVVIGPEIHSCSTDPHVCTVPAKPPRSKGGNAVRKLLEAFRKQKHTCEDRNTFKY